MTPCEELGYKVGDKFTVLKSGTGFTLGQTVTLYSDDETDCPLFQGENDYFQCCDGEEGAYFSLEHVKKIVEAVKETVLETPFVEDTSKHHVHHDLIIAWAKGEKIQYLSEHNWIDTYTPFWDEGREYRIKPEPKPDVIIDRQVYISDEENMYFGLLVEKPNVKFIFNGETRKLKDVQFLGE